jgi:hypothetical protein
MAITLRLTVDYHTDVSIEQCVKLYDQWIRDVETFLERRCGRTPTEEQWVTPKMHDIMHLILKIPERGCTDYHSCNS